MTRRCLVYVRGVKAANAGELEFETFGLRATDPQHRFKSVKRLSGKRVRQVCRQRNRGAVIFLISVLQRVNRRAYNIGRVFNHALLKQRVSTLSRQKREPFEFGKRRRERGVTPSRANGLLDHDGLAANASVA